ncbi:MAG TPA: pectate lyase [Polyangiaceae bacterium]|nr:pectate lyase [Polyangiaceae bacterium]
MFRPLLASIVGVAVPALIVAACSGTDSPGAPAAGGTGTGGTAAGGHSPAGGAGTAPVAGGALGTAGVGSPSGGVASAAGGSPSSGAGMAGAGAPATAGAAGMSVAGSAGGPSAGAGAGGGGGSSPAQGGGTNAGGSGGGSPQQPVSCEPVPAGQQLAFPGAEGFGRFSKGGRGGSVCHVTTLADSGPGSFRDCVSQGNRTVVFQVGGWITLTGNLGITASNITIAGQTAPGGGIGIRGTKLSIGGSNIIMRFFRVRRGIITTSDRNDAMTVSSKASNVIIDHCSVGFGTDENLSMPGDEGIGPRDFTLQWSVVAWGLQRNNHSAGSLLTASNTTIHHSVYAFNGTRNPKARSEEGRTLDFVNNVIYGLNAPDPVGEAAGWGISQHPFLMADTANGMHYANAVGNYFISYGKRTSTQAFSSGATNAAGMPTYNLYFDGNLLDGNANGVLDVSKSDWSMVGTATRLPTRIAAPRVCTDDAPTAFNKVMARVGASLTVRDEVDDALVKAIKAQGGVKIHDETELGVGAQGFGALAAGSAPMDSDRDGMSDAWETQHGLSPSNMSDGNADADADGYTNLEEYLNELAAPAFVF